MRSPLFYIKNPRMFALSVVKRMKWMPDRPYLQLRFRCEMGTRLNLKHPRTFQEKIQWLKLYNRRPEYTTMVDKYAVKQYVADRIGSEYVIPTLGVWERAEDIDFAELPDKFVLKTTHGGGGGGVIVCRDKSQLNVEQVRERLTQAMNGDIYSAYREWPYKNVPRKIIAEQMLELPDKDDLTDYKVFCFNGEPKYIQVIQDRHSCETIDFFDTDWNHQEFCGLNPAARPAGTPVARPANFEDMLKAARILAKDTTFVRVDLYQTEQGMFFGELTFFPASGIGQFSPEQWNLKLGDMLQLPDNEALRGGGKYLIYTELNVAVEVTDEICDYKFFCFNGRCRFFKVDFDRFVNHRANYFSPDWKLLPFGEADLPPVPEKKLLPPPGFRKMINIAERLSAGVPFLRVDLYNVIGRIYFGELTFYPASGMGPFTSVEADLAVGDMIDIKMQ